MSTDHDTGDADAEAETEPATGDETGAAAHPEHDHDGADPVTSTPGDRRRTIKREHGLQADARSADGDDTERETVFAVD